MEKQNNNIFEWFDRLAFLLALVVVPLLIGAYIYISGANVTVPIPGAIELAKGLNIAFTATLITAIIFYLLLRTPARLRARQAETRLIKKMVDAFMGRLGEMPNQVTQVAITSRAIEAVITDFIKPFFDRFSPGHPKHGFYELLWKYLLRGAGHMESEHTFVVNYTSAHTLWRDALVESNSWDAMSYALDLWQNAARDISRAHQEAHVKLGGAIRRVFVVDGEQDLPKILDIMRVQMTFMPVECLRWIYKSELQKIAREQLGIEHLELLDFSIVDIASFVLWFRLNDQTQQPQDAVLTIDPAILLKGRDIFELAFTAGQQVA